MLTNLRHLTRRAAKWSVSGRQGSSAAAWLCWWLRSGRLWRSGGACPAVRDSPSASTGAFRMSFGNQSGPQRASERTGPAAVSHVGPEGDAVRVAGPSWLSSAPMLHQLAPPDAEYEPSGPASGALHSTPAGPLRHGPARWRNTRSEPVHIAPPTHGPWPTASDSARSCRLVLAALSEATTAGDLPSHLVRRSSPPRRSAADSWRGLAGFSADGQPTCATGCRRTTR